jgi:hypothetical protein
VPAAGVFAASCGHHWGSGGHAAEVGDTFGLNGVKYVVASVGFTKIEAK